MERETELTQSWSPELSAHNVDSKEGAGGGLLKGIPLQISGEMRMFSLPMPQDDDGTDISLKDWQLGPSTSTPPFSIKPFKGSISSRFTPVEPRLDEVDINGQSSPDHFETPTTTPRMSSSGTRSSSVSPSQSVSRSGEANNQIRHGRLRGIAFDISSSTDETPPDEATSALRSRSLRVSFKENSNRSHRPSVPVVRHRSPLKSRSILPAKEVKALQPKWESSTKIRPEKTTNSPSSLTKPTVQAPRHGIKARKAGTTSKPAAANSRARAVVASEIEPEGPEIHSSSGYLSEGRYSGRYSGRDSSGHQEEPGLDEFGSNRLSRELTMSPVYRSEPKELENGRSARSPSLSRNRGGHRRAGDVHDSDDDEDETKGGMLCGGGLSDTKLSGDFVRLLSKLCRVSVPKQQQASNISKSVSLPHSSKRSRSIATALSWDSSAQNAVPEEETPSKVAVVMGRQDSLKLLSERCSDAPAPSYSSHKPRKTRNHEPHQHFYRTISKTLDRKLRS